MDGGVYYGDSEFVFEPDWELEFLADAEIRFEPDTDPDDSADDPLGW